MGAGPINSRVLVSPSDVTDVDVSVRAYDDIVASCLSIVLVEEFNLRMYLFHFILAVLLIRVGCIGDTYKLRITLPSLVRWRADATTISPHARAQESLGRCAN